jgi:hypothetical protein
MKARHLREGGVSIPAEINVFCALIEDDALRWRVGFWDMPRHGIDFSPVRLLAEKTPFTCRILPDSVIGIPAPLAR